MIPRQINRIYIPLGEINIEGRIRNDYGDMQGLCESITKHGLLQPIVVNQAKKLVAGGRRLRAHEILKETEIAVVFYETLNDVQLRQLEYEENIQRKDFDWKERILAIDTANTEAARNAILHKSLTSWSQAATGELLGISRASVTYAITLAKYLRSGDKEIHECTGIRDALQVLILRREKEGQKKLAAFITSKVQTGKPVVQKEVDELLHGGTTPVESAEDFFATTTTGGSGGGVAAPSVDEIPGQALQGNQNPTVIPLTTLVQHGDCFTLMAAMPWESIDHIVTDIPYGIEPDYISGAEDVAQEHQIEDNIADFPKFVLHAFKILRPNGFCIFWCDIHHWEKLRHAAEEVGFKVQRWPLIWDKTSPCRNLAAGFNWTKTSELAMVLRKGNATLLSQQPRNVWSGPATHELDHPFAKPALLWQWIYRAIALPGQTVLDPYAGVGSAALAAIPLGLVPISFEIKDSHHHKLVENVQNAYKRLDPNIQFT